MDYRHSMQEMHDPAFASRTNDGSHLRGQETLLQTENQNLINGAMSSKVFSLATSGNNS